MKHVIRIDFSVSNQTERTAAVVQVASPGIATGWSAERERVRVAPSGYPVSPGKTPHFDPLPSRKGRGEEERSRVRNDKRS
jgi:hypothetical protein